MHLNCRAVETGSNLDGSAGKDIFYSLLFSYVSDGTLCRRYSHLKNTHLNHCKKNYRLEMINPFYSNNLSLLYHSSVFFIISLSEAVYSHSFGGMCECNIFGFVSNTHTYTLGCSSSIIAIHMYVLLCKT